ncbi:hypothetical protein F441_10346 [Phytophthora nicotianae CJ01A1]|uniref:Uncharacterized protein n=3 Tax=Phytophthora nicotianae TaxID=4792 RepID=W2R8J4_PHYN3|nr:hypothetical protein PPTG_21118 [Phytophthora nicotianae INRA-310]ETK84908.1 hypothetical protein L915_10170 [Phytophthora nicotianae]ETN21723.1 hypothetical protein PPTG_21118 [Phytophthora nicotianae INRA-310]ETP14733.1 hypothetical protein F441_10346 [Phytophthora nicotianae CJ01A1]
MSYVTTMLRVAATSNVHLGGITLSGEKTHYIGYDNPM